MENYGIGNKALSNGYQRIQGRILDRNPLAKQWAELSIKKLTVSIRRTVGLNEIIEGSKGL